MSLKRWDKKLNIVTTGRDDSNEDENHYPYEPTPYSVLEKLADSGYLSKDSYLIDYGCGKGRVSLFLSWKLGCKSIGIEFDPAMHKIAMQNKENGIKSEQVQFLLMNAEDYEVDAAANCFYFFNPFSQKILQGVIARIKASWYENPREMYLFFYYPSDEYICYLMMVEELEYVDEIDCSELFNENLKRERIMIFKMG